MIVQMYDNLVDWWLVCFQPWHESYEWMLGEEMMIFFKKGYMFGGSSQGKGKGLWFPSLH